MAVEIYRRGVLEHAYVSYILYSLFGGVAGRQVGVRFFFAPFLYIVGKFLLEFVRNENILLLLLLYSDNVSDGVENVSAECSARMRVRARAAGQRRIFYYRCTNNTKII